jgi:hypothetical protein
MASRKKKLPSALSEASIIVSGSLVLIQTKKDERIWVDPSRTDGWIVRLDSPGKIIKDSEVTSPMDVAL